MKCPICQSAIRFEASSATCENGHLFSMKNDVYQILSPEYKERLETFLTGFEDFRKEEIVKYTPEMLRKLPDVSFDKSMWSLRQQDLELILKYVRKGGKAMEVGAWNSWLTQHLARSGMETIAVDIFTHEIDGMGAKKHYPEDWVAIQIDLRRLNLIDEQFDLIVVNRSFQYFQNMEESLQNLQNRLKKGGTLLLTGLTLESDNKRIQLQLDAAAASFESKYGTPFMLHDFQGFLTKENLNQLKAMGLNLKWYPKLRLRSMVGQVVSKRPIYYYGIFEKQ